MDDNDIDKVKVERKIYTREVLNLLRSSELSNLWPNILDKTCINSSGQWDPVKSFDSSKPNESKRNSFYENKSYRNNEKNKDDISLRPERRKWNDGCQVPNNKRNGEEVHTTSYRKSYQGTTPNSGAGDYEKRNFTRNNNRSLKLRDNNILVPEKFSKNNSNSEERRDDDKDEHKFKRKSSDNNLKNNEPEWFSNGPDNCEETIELRGITASDTSIIHFKKDSSKSDVKDDSENSAVKEVDKMVLSFPNEKPLFIDTSIMSPKREGSRFQDIFQKETKNNYLKESKEVENIIKAVLSENVSKIDAEKLNNVSKPLPNGVLTLEEIEKGMTSNLVDCKRVPSKSTTIDTLTSFEPSQNSFLSSGVSSPSVDNSKVVNWLSNLNVNIKESDMDVKSFYPESPSFTPLTSMLHQQQSSMFMSAPYSNMTPTLQHPPGLPLMLNNGHSLQHQQQQQSLLQHSLLQQQSSMSQLLSSQQSMPNQRNIAFFKQLSMNSASNYNIPQRNSPMTSNPQEMFMAERLMLMKQQQQSLHNDGNILSTVFQHANNGPMMNHINDRAATINNHHQQHNSLMAMNGPPGLSTMSRAIVKTHQNSADLAQLQERPIVHNNGHPYHQYTDTNNQLQMLRAVMAGAGCQVPQPTQSSSNAMLENLFNVNPSYLPPLPQQAKYADQIETENV